LYRIRVGGKDVHVDRHQTHYAKTAGASAGPSEMLVSQTVKELVAGRGLAFEDAGERELKAFRIAGASTGR
jgi:hypothetical protein